MTSTCEDVTYWRSKLAEIGINAPKGNRYQLRAIYRGFPSTLVASESSVSTEAGVSTALKFGWLSSTDVRATCCVCRGWREATRTSIEHLIKEKLSFLSKLRVALPGPRTVLSLRTFSFTEPTLLDLENRTKVTIGRSKKANTDLTLTVPDKKVSGLHLELHRLTTAVWTVVVVGTNGACLDAKVLTKGSVETFGQHQTISFPRHSKTPYYLELVTMLV
jgi:hypothetical protein